MSQPKRGIQQLQALNRFLILLINTHTQQAGTNIQYRHRFSRRRPLREPGLPSISAPLLAAGCEPAENTGFIQYPLLLSV